MKKAIMSILIMWILVCGIFVGLIGFDCIGNVKAPYIPHDPFRINSDSEFSSMAGSEGWSGTVGVQDSFDKGSSPFRFIEEILGGICTGYAYVNAIKVVSGK